MTPEILHRCESCGASIREAAMFCPECGKPLATAGAEPAQPSVESAKATAASNQATETIAEAAKTPEKERHGAVERTRETLHRASTAARGAIELPVKQVEKIHHVSTVMLEEAHYDPSLRFVLVALGLFVLFVILLVLSKVMG